MNIHQLSLEYKYTYVFLRQLSLHMSSRKNCKNIEYYVKIDKGKIHVDPSIFCYNDRYHRSDRDRLRAYEHVLKYHFPENFNSNSLLDGNYKYVFTASKKSRHWIKIE